MCRGCAASKDVRVDPGVSWQAAFVLDVEQNPPRRGVVRDRGVQSPGHDTITLSEARSRLDRSRFSRPRPHFLAFFKIYKKITFSRANSGNFCQKKYTSASRKRVTHSRARHKGALRPRDKEGEQTNSRIYEHACRSMVRPSLSRHT